MNLPYIPARITVLSGTTEEWYGTAGKGELIIMKDERAIEWGTNDYGETELVGFKIGDGIKYYKDLPYAGKVGGSGIYIRDWGASDE